MERWSEAEIEKLKLHYKQSNIPSDQILKERDKLENFTEWFNTKFSHDHQFAPEDIADQLLKLRKGGKLPRVRK
jgi:5'-deoxynucleotidase YfbR-like HD superfamily hydrolase